MNTTPGVAVTGYENTGGLWKPFGPENTDFYLEAKHPAFQPIANAVGRLVQQVSRLANLGVHPSLERAAARSSASLALHDAEEARWDQPLARARDERFLATAEGTKADRLATRLGWHGLKAMMLGERAAGLQQAGYAADSRPVRRAQRFEQWHTGRAELARTALHGMLPDTAELPPVAEITTQNLARLQAEDYRLPRFVGTEPAQV